MRYLKIIFKLIKFSFVTQIQYKVNFLLSLPINLAWTIQDIIVALLVYTCTDTIYSWTEFELFLLLGNYFVVDGLFSVLFLPNINDLPEKVRKGELDFVLTKPLDSQFLVFTFRINQNGVIAFLEGVLLIIYSSHKLSLELSPIRIIFFLLFLMCGIVIYSSILFMVSSMSIFTTKLDFLRDFFLTISDYSKKPLEIYPRTIQFITIFLLPVAFIVYFPTLYLLSKNTTVLPYFSIFFALISVLLTRVFWNIVIKHYCSVSS